MIWHLVAKLNHFVGQDGSRTDAFDSTVTPQPMHLMNSAQSIYIMHRLCKRAAWMSSPVEKVSSLGSQVLAMTSHHHDPKHHGGSAECEAVLAPAQCAGCEH